MTIEGNPISLQALVTYQRDVAFPNAYSMTSPTVTQVEEISTI
jgi:hypothetical protein